MLIELVILRALLFIFIAILCQCAIIQHENKRTMPDIIGHTTARSFLDASIKHQLRHAYLFVGEKHLGKFTVAQMFARSILEISQEEEHHPDLTIITEEKKEISVKTVRTIMSACAKKPYSAKHSVIIIEEAEKLNKEASNAILKTLEEPPEYLIIILIAEQKDQLLETIQSRCTILPFYDVSKSEFQEHEISDDEILRIQGKPGRLFQNELLENHTEAKEYLTTCINAPFVKRSAIAKSLSKDRQKAIQICEEWLNILRQLLLQNIHNSQYSTKYQQQLLSLLRTLQRLKYTNCNTQLTLETFLTTLS